MTRSKKLILYFLLLCFEQQAYSYVIDNKNLTHKIDNYDSYTGYIGKLKETDLVKRTNVDCSTFPRSLSLRKTKTNSHPDLRKLLCLEDLEYRYDYAHIPNKAKANLSNGVQTGFSSSAGARLFPVPFPHTYRSYSYNFDGSDEFLFHPDQAYYLSGPPGNGSIELNTSELSQAYEVLANDRFDLRYLIKNGGNSNELSMGRMRVYFYDRDHQSTLLYNEGSPKDYNFYRKSFSHEVIEDGIIEVKIEELVGDRSAFFDEIEVCISPAPPGVLTASNLRRGGFTAN